MFAVKQQREGLIINAMNLHVRFTLLDFLLSTASKMKSLFVFTRESADPTL